MHHFATKFSSYGVDCIWIVIVKNAYCNGSTAGQMFWKLAPSTIAVEQISVAFKSTVI